MLKWSGGRSMLDMPPLLEPYKFVDYITALNMRGISFYFTFSNHEIDINDEDGNFILDKFHNDLNGVIILNDTFAEYVREKYPKYKRVLSCTHYNTNVDYYLKRKNLYDVMVLLAEWNYNEDVIKQIGPEKLEIFANEKCLHDCQFRSEHYKRVSEANRNYWVKNTNFYQDMGKLWCEEQLHKRVINMLPPKDFLKHTTSLEISNKHIEYLKTLGINNFKITSRQQPDTPDYDVLHYIVERIGGEELKESVVKAMKHGFSWIDNEKSSFIEAYELINRQYTKL
jgi:collagenase-like PrtC family protease